MLIRVAHKLILGSVRRQLMFRKTSIYNNG